MKFLQIFFCTLFCFLLIQPNYAQIGKIFDRQGTKLNNAGKKLGDVPKNTAKRVGNNANNKINSTIDRKVDRGIDKVLNPRLQRGSQKGTIKVQNADGSTSERKMTRKEKKALRRQDKADKKKAKKDERDRIKYGSTDEEFAMEKVNLEEEAKKQELFLRQEEMRKNMTAKHTGISTFRLVRRSANNRLDTFFVNSYVNGTRTAVKVREQHTKDKLVHWCINHRGIMQVDDLQSGKNPIPMTMYYYYDEKDKANLTDDVLDTIYKIGSSNYNDFKFQREYKMQTRDSIICAHYLGSNDEFEVEVWADESVKARHFEQFVVDKYIKSPILIGISLLGKINVQIREAVVTDKTTNEIFYYSFVSSNSNAPSSSHFKSEEVGENFDMEGYFNSGAFEAQMQELDDILDDMDAELENAQLDKESAEEDAALRKKADWFHYNAKYIKTSLEMIIDPDM